MILGLIVVLSIDQLRADYLERFAPHFSERGFRRLMAEGAFYPNARLPYALAETAPGHATIGSGQLPSEHGLIGNRWFEHEAAFDEKQWLRYFADVTPYRRTDQPLPALPAEKQWWRQGGAPKMALDVWGGHPARKPPGVSPGATPNPAGQDARPLTGGTPVPRVISVAHKEVPAVLMAGARAHAVYWFDQDLNRFVPDNAFNGVVAGYLPGTQTWTPLPQSSAMPVFDPPAAWPLKNTRYGGTFPHPVANGRALTYSPFAHTLLFDFALHLVHEQRPDLLFVGVSSTDNLGHYYGPDSTEVADSMLRLDRALGDFIDALERFAGAELTLIVTSDHGIQPIPEIARLRDPKTNAGRIDLRNPDPNAATIADLPPLRIDLERRLAARLGTSFSLSMPLPHALIYFFEGTGLYLNRRRVTELRLDERRVERELRDLVRDMEGVADAWTDDEALPSQMRASFMKGRSGDVLVALEPGWIWHWGSNSTTHGQPVDDDLRIPVLLWGKGVTPGRHEAPMSPADLARRYPSRTP